MKDLYLPALFLIAGAFVVAAIIGYIASVKKSFTATQPLINRQQAETIKQKQKRIAEEAEFKRKRLMEAHKQKLRDNRRNY